MKVAILADIHGNKFALDAVVADIYTCSPDAVIVAGDLVGRGPQGSAVVRTIQALGWPCIGGNHEDYLLNFIDQKVPDTWWKTPEWAAARWMANELDVAAQKFIRELPQQLEYPGPISLTIVHGSPRRNTEGLGAWTSDDILEEFVGAIDGDVLVCAHTHRPMVRHVASGTVVNVGSVGLPFNGDTRAQYAILDTSGPALKVEARAVSYNREAFIAHYQTSGFLAEGDLTAALLLSEVKDARPHLVPFLKWAELSGRTPNKSHFDAFYSEFDPSKSMAAFFATLMARHQDHHET